MSDFKQILMKYGLEYFNKYYGTYKGFVASVDDPEAIGRLQLKVPQVYRDQTYKYWAYPKGIYSGNGIGAYWIPNEGDPVWVTFENGDPRFPIWEYGWWAKGTAPDGASPKKKILQTSTGHRLVMDDDAGEICIEDSNGNTLKLNSTGVSVISGKISLGTLDGSDQKAVKGDKLKEKLEELIDAIKLITVPTALGPSGTPINFAQFDVIKTQLITILSNKVTLD